MIIPEPQYVQVKEINLDSPFQRPIKNQPPPSSDLRKLKPVNNNPSLAQLSSNFQVPKMMQRIDPNHVPLQNSPE
jgi:hypothetical protein